MLYDICARCAAFDHVRVAGSFYIEIPWGREDSDQLGQHSMALRAAKICLLANLSLLHWAQITPFHLPCIRGIQTASPVANRPMYDN